MFDVVIALNGGVVLVWVVGTLVGVLWFTLVFVCFGVALVF